MRILKISLSRHGLRLSACLSLLSCLWLCYSCQNERDEFPLHGRTVGFTVTATNDAFTQASPAGTRSAASDTLPQVEITELEGARSADGQPLYLHTLTENGIYTDDEATDAEEAVTRGTPVTTATMHADATVFAATYPATDTWNNSMPPSYFYNVQVKKSENWATSYNWPGSNKKIAFFAYAPHQCTGVTLTSASSTPGAPTIRYIVPTTVTDQTDLLTASSTDVAGDIYAATPLTFKHALTAIRFETGSTLLPGTVTKISLKNVYGMGTYRIGDTNWSAHSYQRNFEQTLSVITPDPNVEGTPITQPAQTFMMIPQTLPTNATVEVVYVDNVTQTSHTLTASIAGKTWEMGKTVTYRINSSSITIIPMLTVTAPTDFTHAGGTEQYKVESYALVSTSGGAQFKKPIAWTTEFSENGGVSWSDTKPAWLTAFTTSGNGWVTPENFSATVTAQTGVEQPIPGNVTLQNTSPVNNGTTNVYDLSTKGGTAPMQTANCYIVNAAGRYCLPLVYGNAVDYVKVPGTGSNVSSYTSTENRTDILKTFINHLGAEITDPYIYSNANCVPANCTLVWQDEPNLVTNVALSSDNHFLEFNVNQATIRQGNAVVAVRNASNEIMWSWHIWVTDYVLGTDLKVITNYKGDPFTIMPINIGWCDGKQVTYAERTVQVRFKQPGTGATQTITVKQKAHNASNLGNNTYFQFGRKDPFVGGIPDGIYFKNKTWYDTNGNIKIDQTPTTNSFSIGDACITSGILNPNTFCINDDMDKKYHNLWSANFNPYLSGNEDIPTVKTIYDPSPAGYRMPARKVFTGFTKTGGNVLAASPLVNGTYNDLGWNFYCNSSQTETVFFPFSGERQRYDGKPNGVIYGHCWTAHTNGLGRGQELLYTIPPNTVGALYSTWGTQGNSVRPCQE